MEGTFSSVPEFLPLDGKAVLHSTAFHADDVVFHVERTNGTLMEDPGL